MYNYIHLIREQHSLPMEEAEIAHVEEVLQTDPEGDDSDIVCVICLSGGHDLAKFKNERVYTIVKKKKADNEDHT